MAPIAQYIIAASVGLVAIAITFRLLLQNNMVSTSPCEECAAHAQALLTLNTRVQQVELSQAKTVETVTRHLKSASTRLSRMRQVEGDDDDDAVDPDAAQAVLNALPSLEGAPAAANGSPLARRRASRR